MKLKSYWIFEEILLMFSDLAIIATIMEIILWDFFMFYRIFFSLQVKRSAVISNKQGVYELVHELSNDLRFRILENKEESGESPNLLEL